MMNSASRSKRHQSTPACSRCHRLKQKCDRGTPRCRRCIAAGTDCMAVSRQTASEVPRSLIQHLEHQLAELQRIKSAPEQSNPGAHVSVTAARPDLSHTTVLEMAALSVSAIMTPDLFKCQGKIQHKAKLFYPSERPPLKIPVRGLYYDVQPRTAGRAYASQFSRFKADKIPIHVARRLFKNYRDEIFPRFPCFLEEDLDLYFDSFYDDGTADPQGTAMSNFVVPMILAISSLTSNSHDFPKVAALGEALHADAMEYSQLLHSSSIPSLQCILLLVQLGLLLPYTVNCWYITGEAMRMAVSLGLHQDPDPAIFTDSAHGELRRKIFWTIYQLDRTVGIAGGCPVSLDDAHITTHLPYNGGDPHTMPERFGLQSSHDFKEAQFLIHTRIRIIQSQIHGVQFFDQPLPGHVEDYEAWVKDTAHIIKGLVNQVAAGGLARTRLESAVYQCEVLLHRPCSRNIAVSGPSLIAAATASIQLISSHIRAVRAGGFVLAFELANSAFQAGMVLLYAVHNHAAELEHTPVLVSSHESLEVLVKLLDTISIRWPALSDTAHYIRELVDTCLRNPVGKDGSAYDMSVLEELDCLVTQRRVHSIHHRNISFPPHHKPGPQSDTASQVSGGFLDDDSWWRAFINDDFEIDGNLLLPPEVAADSGSPPIQAKAPEPRSPYQPVSTTVAELEGILSSLPSCSFCRDRRIKCHQQLPACRECLRTSRECMVFDPIKGNNVSMRRIGFLVENIKQISKEGPLVEKTQITQPLFSDTIVLVPSNGGELTQSPSVIFEDTFLCLSFGHWSSLGSLRRYLRQRDAYKLPPAIQQARCFSAHILKGAISLEAVIPPISTSTSLFQLFSRSTNVFYPVLTPLVLDEVLSQSYTNGAHDASGHTLEFFYLILAIASRLGRADQTNHSEQAESYFNSAISTMSVACNHSSRAENVALLQRTLLICIYLLLSPGSGDIWRHLGFAIRHYFDLAHRPSKEEDEFQDILCTLTRTLYCLESQLSIAFGRPSLLNIGDALRQELTVKTTNNPEEQISIFSYLISLQTLQIHSALLRNNMYSENGSNPSKRTATEALDYRHGLDEWFVRWNDFVATLQDEESKMALSAWGQLNYHLAVFHVSLLWPTPGGKITLICRVVADAGLQLVRHRQLFAKLYSGTWDRKPPFVVPMSWTIGHAVLSLGFSNIADNTLASGDEAERSSSLDRCSLLLTALEADPNNLLAGFGLIFDELRGS